MNNISVILDRWELGIDQVRERVYRAPTPRERERWHALWLLARGGSASQVAEDLGRDAHTIGEWVESFRQKGPTGLAFEQTGGSPPPSTRHSRQS